MLVRVILQRHRGVEIRPGTVDNPLGRLRLVQGKARFAALLDPRPPADEKPKLLLPKLWNYEVTLDGDIMTIQGVEQIGQALHFQEWCCMIQRNQQGSAWP